MGPRLRHDLDRWTSFGLITADQAQAIADYEETGTEQASGLLAEAIGYVGVALAVGAGFLIAENVWDDVSTAGRLAVIATIALAMFAGGWALRRQRTPSIQRLTDVLWLGATAAAGAFAGLFAADVAGLVEEQIVVTVGITVAVTGGTFWFMRRRSLELISVAGGLTIAVLGAAALAFDDPSAIGFGAILWLIGALFFACGHFTWLAPPVTAQLIGLAGIAFGSQVLAGEGGLAGAVAAGASAGAIVAYAVRCRDDVALAIGGVMVLLLVPQLVFAVFGDSLGAPVALLVAGGALVALAVSVYRARMGLQ